MPKKAKNPRSPKWTSRYAFDAYDLARVGHGNAHIAKQLGITPQTYHTWYKNRPAFRYAIRRARRLFKRNETPAFAEYIYRQLPDDLQEVWNELCLSLDSSNPTRMIETILGDRGVKARQMLFIHALIHSSFNPSQACQIVNITYQTLLNWSNHDETFAKLLEEVQWHRKNFFEQRLVNLVERGEPSAVLFVNRTVNRDRGYSEKFQVEHTGSVEHRHVVSVDDLDLPLEIRQALLKAYRDQRGRLDNGGDVEPRVLEANATVIEEGES